MASLPIFFFILSYFYIKQPLVAASVWWDFYMLIKLWKYDFVIYRERWWWLITYGNDIINSTFLNSSLLFLLVIVELVVSFRRFFASSTLIWGSFTNMSTKSEITMTLDSNCRCRRWIINLGNSYMIVFANWYIVNILLTTTTMLCKNFLMSSYRHQQWFLVYCNGFWQFQLLYYAT